MSRMHHTGHAIHAHKAHQPMILVDSFMPMLDLDLSDKRTEVIEKKVAIPSMPEMVVLLEREINAKHPNTHNIISIIEKNSVVTGELLHAFNTPAFQQKMRRPVEVRTVAQAMSLFGIERIYRVAVASALQSIPAKNELFQVILAHSSEVAYASAEISGYVANISMEIAYLYGLFMHGGMLMLASGWPTEYEPIFNLSLSMPATAVMKEEEKFKRFRHDYLGVDVARRWGFGHKYPESQLAAEDRDVLLAIQEQHNPNYHNIGYEQTRLLIAIGSLAQILVNELIYGVYIADESNIDYYKAKEVLVLTDEALSNIRMNIASYFVGA